MDRTERLDRLVVKHAIHHWFPPEHPAYNQFDVRLNYFKNWPKGKPSSESLSEAGFLREYVHFTNFLNNSFLVSISLQLYQTFSLQVSMTKQSASIAE